MPALSLVFMSRAGCPPWPNSWTKSAKVTSAICLRRGDLEGKPGQMLLLHHVPNVLSERVLLVGCGKERELDERQYRQIIAKNYQYTERDRLDGSRLFSCLNCMSKAATLTGK